MVASGARAAKFFSGPKICLFSARSCALVVVNAYSKRGKRATISGFCKISGSADFEKLWSKQVFMFSFNENGLYFTTKPCYFQFENDHNYEKTWTYKVRILSIWCETSATPYFHERSYEKTRTYKVRILSHLMRFYLKKGWNITRRPLCDGWNPYRLLAFFQIKSHQMIKILSLDDLILCR